MTDPNLGSQYGAPGSYRQPQQVQPYGQPGYQQPGYQHPGYQQPGYGQPVYQQQVYVQSVIVAPPRGLSIASMIIGIASIVFGWTLLAPIAGLVLGIVGARKEPAGRGFSITGIILNGLILLGWGIVVVLIVLSIAGVIGTLGTAATVGTSSNS